MIPLSLVMGLFAAAPKVGDIAPDFTVKDIDGKTYHLAEVVKSGPVILAFFPKAFTRGCTKELTAFGGRYGDIEKRKGTVLAVSTDDADTLKRFKESLKAPFSFVSDKDETLVSLFDVKMPVVSMAKRYTFVIGAGNKILEVQSGGDAIEPEAAIAACPVQGH